jgi:dTDP-glucose 4,6-dehydratase
MLTGAAGFIGSHALRHVLMNTDWHVVCPVSFRHRGLPARIEEQVKFIPGAEERFTVIKTDLTSPVDYVTAHVAGDVDYIVNFASESHVDRSIEAPGPFIANNVSLMTNMLDYARIVQPKAFIQISTDEVYGPAPAGYAHKEWDMIKPSNPYSASKAAQEAIAFSYWRSYGVPLIITNCMNLIGEMQDPEKFVPMTLRKILRGEVNQIHAARDPNGTWTSSSRFYLHARNLADAVLFLLRNRTPVNFSGERETPNDEIVDMIGDLVGVRPKVEYTDFHAGRPGHDMRYALDGSKIEALGWKRVTTLEESMSALVKWTMNHPTWANL